MNPLRVLVAFLVTMGATGVKAADVYLVCREGASVLNAKVAMAESLRPEAIRLANGYGKDLSGRIMTRESDVAASRDFGLGRVGADCLVTRDRDRVTATFATRSWPLKVVLVSAYPEKPEKGAGFGG